MSITEIYLDRKLLDKGVTEVRFWTKASVILFLMYLKVSEIITEIQDKVWYEVVFLLLALSSLFFLILELFFDPKVVVLETMENLDLAIACIFLADFFLGLFFHKHYSSSEYVKKYWLNFLSSIPITLDAIHVLRLLRAVKAIRVIRAAVNVWYAEKRLMKPKK
jgi:hypothetical protein